MGNMFRCTLASGGALILTVTSDSAFAGQTITCTDGTTTLTQICPSTSPYTVEFKIPNGGTWTISSGMTSTSVTIPSSAELHNIPNGSTITPTDDIQIWLHCANIWDKSYTTITQVLNDASTLQALIASSNAADYMARSTTWASDVTADQSAMSYIGLDDYCADALLADSTWLNAICNSTYFESILNVKVPTMTSNTTPSGTCFASSNDPNTTYFATWKAFDGNNGSAWACGTGKKSANLGYIFTSAVKIKKIFAKFRYDGSSENSITYKIEGSNDGNTWTDISSSTTKKLTQGMEETILGTLSNSDFTHFRISFTTTVAIDVSGSYVGGIYTLQFYGRA